MKFNKSVSCQSCANHCDIHQSITKDEHFSAASLKPLHAYYKKNEHICKQGSQVTHAIYLTKGSAKLYIEGINNRNITLYILTPNSYIGLLAFFETPYYSYSVTALEEAEICMIELDFVKRLYIQNHDFLIRLNQAFGKSVSSIMRKIITLNQKNIRGRIADSLLYLAELNKSDRFSLLLTRKDLGELSAISEENCVRLLTEFRKEGFIQVEGRHITLLEKGLLKKISEFG